MESLDFSINTDGYHWSFNRGAGGWIQALAKYRQKDWGKMAGGAGGKHLHICLAGSLSLGLAVWWRGKAAQNLVINYMYSLVPCHHIWQSGGVVRWR